MTLNSKIKDHLIESAIQASKAAYAPYSKYKVGAALLSGSGKIYTGCNVENASYGLTICAERVAIFSARAAGESIYEAIAIYAPSPPAPIPCGACRQVMAEGGNKPLVIVIDGDQNIQELSFEQILPYTFELK